MSLAPLVARAVEGTELRELQTYVSPPIPERVAATELSVTSETTIEAIHRLATTGEHVGCLNVASARHPGGGFLGGAQAQEESLARSSALYPCLVTQPAHYGRNRAHRSALYLDLAIFSPGVPFFRDDDGAWLDAPVPYQRGQVLARLLSHLWVESRTTPRIPASAAQAATE